MEHVTILAVSDGTAITVKLVIQAALAQFPGVEVELKPWARVNTEEKILQVIGEAAREHGIIVYTLVSPPCREFLIREAKKANVPAIDLLGPLLFRLEEFLKVQPKGLPGIFKPSLHEYDPRIEAINFTVDHDDGQNIHSLEQADIVILGVSRASKTPLSIFLSSRGWKVANIPIIPGVELFKKVYEIDQKKIVGLTIKPEQLATIRQNRMAKFNLKLNNTYVDTNSVQKEIAYAEAIFQKSPDWPVIEVTHKSIEEIAQEVLSNLAKR